MSTYITDNSITKYIIKQDKETALKTLYKNIDRDSRIVAEIIDRSYNSGKNSLYSYRMYYENNKTNRKDSLLRFESRHYKEKLLEGLFNYFNEAFTQLYTQDNDFSKKFILSNDTPVPIKIRYCFANGRSYNVFTKEVENYIEKIGEKEFTNKNIVTILTLNHKINLTNKDSVEYYVNKQLDYFNNKDNKIENMEDFYRYCNPNIMDLTDKEILFFNNIMPLNIHIINNDDLLRLFYKMYYIYYHNNSITDKTVTLDEYTVDDSIKESFNNDKFMRYNSFFDYYESAQYRADENLQYVRKLTIGQFEKIFNRINLGYKNDHFIKLANMIVETDVSSIDYTAFMALIDDLFDKNDKNDKSDYNNIDRKYCNAFTYNLRLSNSTISTDIKINKRFMEYVMNNKKGNNSELVHNYYYIRCFIDANYDNFLLLDSEKKESEFDFLMIDDTRRGEHYMGAYIIDQLCNIMSFEELFELFENLPKKLKLEQWLYYLDNYEEYKNMPVSWVAELLE